MKNERSALVDMEGSHDNVNHSISDSFQKKYTLNVKVNLNPSAPQWSGVKKLAEFKDRKKRAMQSSGGNWTDIF